MNNKRNAIIAVMALSGITAYGQLVVNTNVTPQSMVNDVLVGSCVGVANVTYNGSATPPPSATERGTFTAMGTNLGLSNGIVLTTGNASNLGGPSSTFNSSIITTGTDADLQALSGQTINDISILEFDFVPNGDSISFRYIFASEEYPEFVCSTFNDAFGFFLSGPGINGTFSNNAINIAVVPSSTIPITINTVNIGTPGGAYDPATCALSDPNWVANSIYYVDNSTGLDVVYDAFTTVLTARASVQCNQTYHIKLAIGDGSDSSYDSAVFLEGGSFSSVPFVPQLSAGPSIVGDTIYESCLPLQLDFLRTGCDVSITETVTLSYSGTAVNGTDVTPALPTVLVFAPGDTIISIPFSAPVDADGVEELILTLSALDCNGDTATNVFTFILSEVPPLLVSDSTVSVPCGTVVSFLASVSGGFGQYTYAWNVGGNTPFLDILPLAPTVYQVTVTDLCNVSTTSDFTVNLTPAPPLNMNILGSSDLVEGCEVGTVNVIRPPGAQGAVSIQLIGSGTATSGTDYVLVPSWEIPAGVLNNQFTVPVLDDALMEGNETIIVTGSYTNPCAQTVSASVTFTILDVEPLTLSTNDIQAECSGDTMLIAAVVDGGSLPYTYLWSSGEQVGSIYVPLQDDGTYSVTVTDDCGRTISDAATVSIDCELTIPNVFSPNNDGRNDRWEIDGLRSSGNNVRVFNRWGQVVFEKKNYANNWTASDIPDGTYFYEILVDRKPNPYTGHLTILRPY